MKRDLDTCSFEIVFVCNICCFLTFLCPSQCINASSCFGLFLNFWVLEVVFVCVLVFSFSGFLGFL